MYPKKYLQVVNLYYYNKKTLKITHDYKLLFITNNLNELENYIYDICKNMQAKNKGFNFIFDLGDSYFRDLKSLSLENIDFNFYGLDYIRNPNCFIDQLNMPYYTNILIKDLLTKDLTNKK